MVHNSLKDVGEGIVGALGMALAFVTPMLREQRSHWGLTEAEVDREYPGDDLVPEPRWDWTHGIRIEAPMEEVWPWIVQIGQGRGGFYSYQWLENIAGCEVENADRILPELQVVRIGDPFKVHPEMDALTVAGVETGRYFVVSGGGDLDSGLPLKPGTPLPDHYLLVSWLFYLEPLDGGACRFISRYRCDLSDDPKTRRMFGATTVEPIGFVMDRRMLLGVKERVEAARARKA